jgi:glutaredoxin
MTVYVTQTCPYCRQVQQFLQRHHIGPDRVRLRFVDQDPEAAKDFRALGFSRVPAFESPTMRWEGVDWARLRAVLNIRLVLPGEEK